jgi:hypothetical protein
MKLLQLVNQDVAIFLSKRNIVFNSDAFLDRDF